MCKTRSANWYDALDSDGPGELCRGLASHQGRTLNALLTDKDSLSGRIEDAGLDPADLARLHPEKNWHALQDRALTA